MALVTITVDGKKISANKGGMLLPALLGAGFDIPHMCFNSEIQPFGACRLCLVEIDRGDWRRVVVSCSYPVSDGLSVFTDSERLTNHRRMVAELLLTRCPDVPEVKALAKRLGVEGGGRFSKKNHGCILCGLCTRACEQVVGVSAISFVGRGPDKEVATPFLDESKVCIGCGSCAYICPVDYIKVEENEKTRKFPQWKTEFKFVRCKKCGQKIGTDREIELMAKRAGTPEDWFEVCQNCR